MRKVLQYIRKKWLYFLIWITGYIPLSFLVHVKGKKHIPKRGGAILVANHESLMDSPMICMLTPLHRHLRWIGKHSIKSASVAREEFGEIYKKEPIIHRVGKYVGRSIMFFVARETGTIVIKPGESTVQRVVETLHEEQGLVGIFPKGVRRHIDPDAKPRSGFVVIARKARVPVVPVVFYRRSFLRWHFRVLPHIPVEKLDSNHYGETDHEKAHNIMKLVDKHIA